MMQPCPTPDDTPSLAALQGLVAEDLRRVDGVILARVTQDVALINDIARHIIASGGKRLRPALTLACAQLCEYTGTQHIDLAAAVELIHTATLLHDDVVDESALRRGDATANVLWSNQASVLVGDFLLSRAFQLMVSTGNLEVLEVLSSASATISQGEVLQLSAAHEPTTTAEIYLEVITAKTATLFAAACELGAIIGGKPELRAALRDFGLSLGIAFQLVDDALDYSAEEAKLGKTVGDDFREGKITLPVILAYGQGDDKERAFWQRTLAEEQQKDGDLQQAMQLIARHATLAATLELARDYTGQAETSLKAFPASPVKDALLEALAFCVYRAY